MPAIVLALAAALLLLGGCSAKNVSELYAPPEQSDAYYNLQNAINQAMVTGDSYSAPTGGENQQAVQLADLDGDSQDEALVFIRSIGEKPLKIYIFKRSGDSYTMISKIEGDGASFDSVKYIEMDGSPGLEMVVGRSVGEQVLQSLSVYTLTDGQSVELMSATYSEYINCDLDQDGRSDLLLIRFDADERTGICELYRYRNGIVERDPEQSLSNGVDSIKRIITGYAAKDTPAVFVASVIGDAQLCTDVLVMSQDKLKNITRAADTGSPTTVRNYYAYSMDIDGDGLIELPEVETLPDLTDAGNTDTYRIIHWYNLLQNGSKSYKILTYHDYSSGWYVVLDEAWDGRVTITRDEAETGITAYHFNQWNGSGKQPGKIFTIYVLTGENAMELAGTDGRFYLATKSDVVYAASIGNCEWSRELTQQILVDRFHFIYQNWNSGET